MPVDFSRLVIFGDSLSDTGNLPRPARPDAPYVNGRFSNGPIYADVLPRELGVPSLDLALGGAEAAPDVTENPEQLAVGLPTQVERYLARVGHHAPAGTAAVIFVGANDYFDALPVGPADGQALVGRVLEGVDEAATDLARAGVDRLFLYTLPDLSVTPRGRALPPAEKAGADALIAANNAGLKSLAATYNALGVETTVVDINRLDREIAADRETFGLKVIETPLYAPGADGALHPTGVGGQVGADRVAFFDPVHPTTVAHGIVAAFSEATIRADRVDLRGTGSQTIFGQGGSDFIFAGSGDDAVFGGAGRDVIFAGLGQDRVSGGPGSDLISGGSGADRLDGGANSDLLAGNAGRDFLTGGLGNDVLIDRAGAGRESGGAGADLLIFDANGTEAGRALADGGAGVDTLRLLVSDDLFASQAFRDELAAFAPGKSVAFTSLDLSVQGVERLEVVAHGTTVFTSGHEAVKPGPDVAVLLRDADLWGLV